MRNREIQSKHLVRARGEVQFPIKVGEEAYYRQGDRLIWTDKVKRILCKQDLSVTKKAMDR